MNQMVMLVLDEIDVGDKILDAWLAAGVPGVTIMESSGIGRRRDSTDGMTSGFPLLPSIKNFVRSREEPHRTLFTVVDDEALVEKLIESAQVICGGLDLPNKGVIFVLPVSRVVGVASMTKE